MPEKVEIKIKTGTYLPGEIYSYLEEQLSGPMFEEFGPKGLRELLRVNVDRLLGQLIDKGYIVAKTCYTYGILYLIPECTDYFYVSENPVSGLIDISHNGSRTWNIVSLRSMLVRKYGLSRMDAIYQTEKWRDEGKFHRVGLRTYTFSKRLVDIDFGFEHTYIYETIGETIPPEEVKLYMASIAWRSGGGGIDRKGGAYPTKRIIKIYAYLLEIENISDKQKRMNEALNAVLSYMNYPETWEIEMWHPPDRGDHLMLLQEPDREQEHGYWEYIKDGEIINSGKLTNIDIVTGVPSNRL